jgi:hypothetical protein
MMLFIEGLMETLKGWVKAFKPTNLQDAIWRTRDLGPAAKPKFVPRPPLNTGVRDQRPPMSQGRRDPRGFDRGRGRLDENTFWYFLMTCSFIAGRGRNTFSMWIKFCLSWRRNHYMLKSPNVSLELLSHSL